MGGTGGRLTTHVLDTASGRPAGGLAIRLLVIEADRNRQLVATMTNRDGRCERPLLEGSDFRVGVYELHFHIAAYFAATGVPLPTPPFLDVVPVRFGIADTSTHYHVPLLISPYGYSTYRGS